MTEIQLWEPAGDGEKFALHAWDGQVGRQVPVRVRPGGAEAGLCTLVAAEVAEDGSGVLLTIRMPEYDSPVPDPAPAGMSFAFREPDPDPGFHDPLSAKTLRIGRKP